MKTDVKRKSSTEVEVTVEADSADLEPIKKRVLNQLRQGVKADGFRPGRAPDHIVEKEVGSDRLQAEVVEAAAASFYGQFSRQHNLRAVQPPHVELKKFVPHSQMEMVYSFETLPEIKLADYRNIKKARTETKVSEEDINSVIEGLRIRAAKRSEVKRAAKSGDEVMIDFEGNRDGVKVPGAQAKNYSILIGSGRLVPGFEEALVGNKAGESKEFDVVFPGDYAEPTLQNKKVHFKSTIHSVWAVDLPPIDDKFAADVGPFKDLTELKTDIKKQLEIEKEQDARRVITDEIVDEIGLKSQLELPKGLVAKQLEELWANFEANISRDGQTLDDYFKSEDRSREDVEKLLGKEAERRVKTALVLSEIARTENIEVTPEELEIRLQLLKGQHQDKQMSRELDRPEAKNQIADQLLIEKTVNKLVEYATK